MLFKFYLKGCNLGSSLCLINDVEAVVMDEPNTVHLEIEGFIYIPQKGVSYIEPSSKLECKLQILFLSCHPSGSCLFRTPTRRPHSPLQLSSENGCTKSVFHISWMAVCKWRNCWTTYAKWWIAFLYLTKHFLYLHDSYLLTSIASRHCFVSLDTR